MAPSKKQADVLFMRTYEHPVKTSSKSKPGDVKLQTMNLLFGGPVLVPKKNGNGTKKSHERINSRLAADNGGSTDEDVVLVEVLSTDSEPATPPQEPKKADAGNGKGNGDKNAKGREGICPKKNGNGKQKKNNSSCLKNGASTCLKNSKTDRKGAKKSSTNGKDEDSEAGYQAETSESEEPAPPKQKNSGKGGKSRGKTIQVDSETTADETSDSEPLKETNKKAKKSKDKGKESTTDVSDAQTTTTAEASSSAAATVGGETSTDGEGGETSGTDEAVQTTEDASIKEKSEGTQTKGSSTAEWTPSQDANIRALKGAGDTWAQIATVIGRSKKEIQKRWKELNEGSDAEANPPAPAAPAEPSSNVGPSDETENEADNEASGVEGVCVNKSRKKVNKGKAKGKIKNDKGESPGGATARSPSGSSSSSSAGFSPVDYAEELAAQKDHIFMHNYAARYPTDLDLEEDQFWSERDVCVLGMLDSRYRADRWLQLQADFFNATGRMVPLEILKMKVEDAEKKKARKK